MRTPTRLATPAPPCNSAEPPIRGSILTTSSTKFAEIEIPPRLGGSRFEMNPDKERP
jgi:hypothetical protein